VLSNPNGAIQGPRAGLRLKAESSLSAARTGPLARLAAAMCRVGSARASRVILHGRWEGARMEGASVFRQYLAGSGAKSTARHMNQRGLLYRKHPLDSRSGAESD